MSDARRKLQATSGLALSHFLDDHLLTETSCFDIAGAVLDAIEQAGGKVIVTGEAPHPFPRNAADEWFARLPFGGPDVDEPVYVNVLGGTRDTDQ